MKSKKIIAAQEAYKLLVDIAEKEETITYKDLGGILGYHERNVGSVLSLIQNHCLYEDLPPITRLVVNSYTGMPGKGYKSIKGYEKDLENVLNCDWKNLSESNKYSFKEKYL